MNTTLNPLWREFSGLVAQAGSRPIKGHRKGWARSVNYYEAHSCNDAALGLTLFSDAAARKETNDACPCGAKIT
jgi:hypothetical protein